VFDMVYVGIPRVLIRFILFLLGRREGIVQFTGLFALKTVTLPVFWFFFWPQYVIALCFSDKNKTA